MLYNIKDFTKELNIYNTIEFKKLDNFDNYFIYEDGRVYSFKLKRYLKPTENDGYNRIELKDDNKKRKSFAVHRLVYETFKGPIPEGLQVDHINGIRNDNRLINLRLLTNKENSLNRHNLEQYKEIDRKTYLRKKDYNKLYFKEYKEKHKEDLKQYKKDYYEKHKGENQEKYKKYREEHREERREKGKLYYEEHKQEINRKRREKRLMDKMNKIN